MCKEPGRELVAKNRLVARHTHACVDDPFFLVCKLRDAVPHYFPPFQIFRERPTASTKYQTMNGEISRKKKATVRMSSIVLLSDCGHFAHASREARAQRPQSLDMRMPCSRSLSSALNGRNCTLYSGRTMGAKSRQRYARMRMPGW